MVEIIFGDNRELARLEGKTVAEVRKEYEDEFEIPGRAEAVLNGVQLKKKLESDTKLDEGDELCFVAKSRIRTPMLITAALVALALTSGVFAYTFITDSLAFTNVSSAGGDFASVSGGTSPTWKTFGQHQGTITGNTTIFSINTTGTGYTGDLVSTVSISNADSLSKVYRVLSLKIEVYDSGGAKMDINSDNSVDLDDYTLLTLKNGAVDVFINQDSSDDYEINVVSGFYISHVHAGWGTGVVGPTLFCDVAQR